MQQTVRATTSLIFCAALLMGGVGVAAAQGLPGGASSLNETHGDWQVICTAQEGNARCTISQTQVNNENRQRLLAIELAASEAGNAASGTLLLPFGLKLDDGAIVSIDEAAALQTPRFSTCLPAGCLVPLTFNREAVTAMRAGTALKIRTTANDSGQEVNFSISLAGFTSALARVAELTPQ